MFRLRDVAIGYHTMISCLHGAIIWESQTNQDKYALKTTLFLSTRNNCFSRLQFTCAEYRSVQGSPREPLETPRVERSLGILDITIWKCGYLLRLFYQVIPPNNNIPSIPPWFPAKIIEPKTVDCQLQRKCTVFLFK